MCRINGLIKNHFEVSDFSGVVTSMRDSMSHGGPDDAGIYVNEKLQLALGHRRLSLLDLSPSGHQPMFTNDKDVVICFNGEIYNFQEIKRQLEEKGYNFFSSGDTEVILNAYKEWGEKAFTLFNGMFAFALVDLTKNLFFLVRDPSGIKPLYYSHQENSLFFSSEMRGFMKTGLFQENEKWKILFLTFGFIPEPYTSLKDVFMLPKGHYYKYDLDKRQGRFEQYYSYQYTHKIKDKEEAVFKIRETLDTAIRRHLISDAPLGIFLSGGIDSSIIALAAGSELKENLRSLSVIFDEPGYSEKKYQQMVLEKLNNKHQFYKVDKSIFIKSLPDILNALDQPSIDAVNTYFISQCAKDEGLKAVLSGLGADELLGGYPSFNRIQNLQWLKKMPSVFFDLIQYSGIAKKDKFKKLNFLKIEDDLGLYLTLRGMYLPQTVASILDISLKEVLQTLESCYLGDAMSSLSNHKNTASWMETNIYMQNQLLKDSDFMSMWHSIEVRVPFLDKEFIELALSIDPSVKFNGRPKSLLIEAYKDVLPEGIWNRPKQGFTFPFQLWFKDSGVISEFLDSKSPAKKALAQQFLKGDLHWTRLWSLYLTDHWGKSC